MLNVFGVGNTSTIPSAFVVYFPATVGGPTLPEVAAVVTHTLLHYLAVSPTSFLRHSLAEKIAISRLLSLYARPHSTLRLQQAGLLPISDGNRMLQEIKDLIQSGASQDPVGPRTDVGDRSIGRGRRRSAGQGRAACRRRFYRTKQFHGRARVFDCEQTCQAITAALSRFS